MVRGLGPPLLRTAREEWVEFISKFKITLFRLHNSLKGSRSSTTRDTVSETL